MAVVSGVRLPRDDHADEVRVESASNFRALAVAIWYRQTPLQQLVQNAFDTHLQPTTWHALGRRAECVLARSMHALPVPHSEYLRTKLPGGVHCATGVRADWPTVDRRGTFPSRYELRRHPCFNQLEGRIGGAIALSDMGEDDASGVAGRELSCDKKSARTDFLSSRGSRGQRTLDFSGATSVFDDIRRKRSVVCYFGPLRHARRRGSSPSSICEGEYTHRA